MADYQGQEFREGAEAKDAPPAPGTDGLLRQGGTGGVFSRVVMLGNYGALCGSSQTLTFSNVTEAQARKLKWDYYGVCSCVMTCYGPNGDVILEA